jgi:hypothetical protein
MGNQKDNLIHVRTAARQYGLPVKWLKDQAKSGAIPALVAENQVLFDADILAGWLAERARGAACE